ncbi:MAG: endonuclease III [Thermoleophilia bacterium]
MPKQDKDTSKSTKWRREQAREVLDRLEQEYPGARTALEFRSDWEMLVATILSAQATDKKVNEVTRRLFEKYRSIEDYASADPQQFEQDIRETGFFRNKTKSVLGAARKVLHEYGGEVPHSIAELLTLPGVARKTANVVLKNIDPAAYESDPDAGIAVDTHVHRLATRLGLASGRNPSTTEQELMEIIPRERWGRTTYLLIDHGRAVCTARKPRCPECVLNDICPSAFTF